MMIGHQKTSNGSYKDKNGEYPRLRRGKTLTNEQLLPIKPEMVTDAEIDEVFRGKRDGVLSVSVSLNRRNERKS